ncbi:MAG: RecQ family ATP-dependent DNA helicase [Anaerolineales bacterium]
MPASIDLKAALTRHFSFPEFRPGQQQALEYVLAGHDTLVVMPTGHGKSLIYQLAALLRPGTTLVISPLISLMKDQVDSLTRRDIPATLINSSISTSQQSQRLRAMGQGFYKIVLVAPERLRSQSFLSALKRVSIDMLVVDEAHCLSQWGHNFRPDYLHIAELRQCFKIPMILALTATATQKVQDDIIELLRLSQAKRLITGFNRPNLSLEVFSTPNERAKLSLLSDFLTAAEGAGIVYAGTRRAVEEIAEFISQVVGILARPYHAGMEADERYNVQEAFMAGDLPLVVATNAFGMGIDRPDVRFVLHYSVPGSLEAYYQEAGRAGRDSLPARAILLYAPQDVALQEYFLENSHPTSSELKRVHQFVLDCEDSSPTGGRTQKTFFWDELTATTGIPEVKARVALEQLEAAHALIRFPNQPGNTICVQALELGTPALKKIAAQVETFRQHKQAMLLRMVDYALTNECRRQSILDYFGDTGSAQALICCDNCLAQEQQQKTSFRKASSQYERAALVVLQTVAELSFGLGRNKIALILNGSRAKAVTRFTAVRTYGRLTHLRLKEIETLIDQLQVMGYLKAAGSRRPFLVLTPIGKSALKAGAAISINLHPLQEGASRREKVAQQAGATVLQSGEMLKKGLNPEQIAAARGLTVNTIYSHLSHLIASGPISLDMVVPEAVQRQIRAAIEATGTADRLTPIKERLPESISYNQIRCVIAALKPKNEAYVSQISLALKADPVLANEQLFADLRKWRLQKARAMKRPAFVVFSDKTLKGIAAALPCNKAELLAISGVGLIKANQYGSEVLALVKEFLKSGKVDGTKPLSSARPASGSQSGPDEDLIESFLSRPHPQALKGPWLAGYALDFHSRFVGSEQVRGIIGKKVFRYKYKGERHLARELACRLADLLAGHPELPRPDFVVPVPASIQRSFDPVANLAQELSDCLDIQVLKNGLIKVRTTRPQKELKSLAAKKANIAGAFKLAGQVKGKRLLLVDDLYDSGATLTECAGTLARGSPASIVVLTLTKTIHADS